MANGVPAGTVRVGDSLASVPLRTIDDAETTIAEVAAGRPAVLVFYLGAWCPYCNLTLNHYNETLAPALAERDVALIAISPQHADGSRAAVANGDLGSTVLSDPATASPASSAS
ncbi:redoxin domain-containing protein [Glaciibacter flavus]|uniref:redoxin domain-containing protein n=1 Tax=Orlajensenia flava TaxID=2565934 RepID=UPI003B00FCAC